MYTIQLKQEDLMPRERLVNQGAESLSNQELLAILLRTGTKQEPVLTLSHRILENMATIAQFRHMSLQELQAIGGIGKVKAIQIKAMLEFAKRINAAEIGDKESVLGSHSVGQRMMVELGHEKQEHLVAIYLDTQHRIIEKRTIFIGSIRRSIAEPREILHYACKNMAHALIVVHNHPSGSTEPSFADDDFTEKIKRCCDDLGLLFLDHIIVSHRGYFSYREERDELMES